MTATVSAVEGLTEAERYRFDLEGYVVRRGVLGRREIATANAAIDDLRFPTPGDAIASQRFNRHLAVAQVFRDLIDHEGVLGILLDLCGPAVRLDHAYGLVMTSGTGGLGLHGGGTPHDSSQFYDVRGGRMFNGLVAVAWALVDHPVDRGGFCCIPGSHRANFGVPTSCDRTGRARCRWPPVMCSCSPRP